LGWMEVSSSFKDSIINKIKVFWISGPSPLLRENLGDINPLFPYKT
jgi:hypothetical protein